MSAGGYSVTHHVDFVGRYVTRFFVALLTVEPEQRGKMIWQAKLLDRLGTRAKALGLVGTATRSHFYKVSTRCFYLRIIKGHLMLSAMRTDKLEKLRGVWWG